MDRKTQLIIALDVDTREQAMAIANACGSCEWFKVGLQLFSRTGPPMVKYLVGRDAQVFLDLKLHDIPNTVAKAAKAAADLGVSLATLHAAGGRKMIEAARRAVDGTDTKLLAVTVLTSLNEDMLRSEVGLQESVGEAVARYAKLAVESGAHGIVASPHEIGIVREAIGPEPLIVTPGIRPAWAAADDQARFMTPRQAAEAGADFIVVGRPIVANEDPATATVRVIEELSV
ncbi:MAG: orotidine-5'-phosphate decarboxylase [Candidatus Hydrogenedentes bacterium]|nr:orotidine-5'-phosphate decarboxylase [Candidatus Hydrogenedentota bacterium]